MTAWKRKRREIMSKNLVSLLRARGLSEVIEERHAVITILNNSSLRLCSGYIKLNYIYQLLERLLMFLLQNSMHISSLSHRYPKTSPSLFFSNSSISEKYVMS